MLWYRHIALRSFNAKAQAHIRHCGIPYHRALFMAVAVLLPILILCCTARTGKGIIYAPIGPLWGNADCDSHII
jgi:hypothetical protein